MVANAMSDNLDRNLAVFGAVSSALLAGGLMLMPATIAYAVFTFYIFFACVAYLAIRPRLRAQGLVALRLPALTDTACILLNTAFFAGFAYAVLSITLRSYPYTRPLGFFVSVGILAALLAVESLLLPTRRGYAYIVLAKIILVGMLVRWIPQVMFPGHVWFDPWFHEYLTKEIVSTSYVPQIGSPGYAKLPVMHLLLSASMLVAGTDFKSSFMLVVEPLQVIVHTVFIYLLAAGFISTKRLALLAALMVTIADVVIAKALVAYPNTLAVILMVAIVYTIFRARQRSSTKLSVLSFVLLGTLILTHTLGALALTILLFCFWLGSVAYQRIHHVRARIPTVTFILCILFMVAMLSWWMYASSHFTLLAKAIRWAFQLDYFEPPAPEQAIAYSSGVPVSEVLLDRFGFSVYYALAAMGCLYLMGKRSTGKVQGFGLALGGVLLTTIGFFGPVLNAWIITQRWHFVSQVVMAIPAALGIILLSGSVAKCKALLLGVIVGLVSFSMVTDVVANFDTPVFSSARLIRAALTNSELESMDTVVEYWDGVVASDAHAAAYLAYGKNTRTRSIDESLDAESFLFLKGDVVLIRDYITNKPFHTIGNKAWKLDYDPRQILMMQRFEQLYDSGSAMLFYLEE